MQGRKEKVVFVSKKSVNTGGLSVEICRNPIWMWGLEKEGGREGRREGGRDGGREGEGKSDRS